MSNPFIYSNPSSHERLLKSDSQTAANIAAFRTEQYIHAAFRLAYFICPDKAQATSITIQALDNIEWAYSAQSRRLYYSPTGYCLAEQSRSQALRTKVLMSKPHLLQHLIYVEAEPYEKEQERQPPTLSQEDMIIRFVKHLVRITARRNSFYVTLGLGRLLYGYGTPETMGLYNVVVQNPQRVKEDAYYRLRKKQLLEEVKDRFGDSISTARGPRGEEVFEAEASSEKYTALVKSSLVMFTPWETNCVVPESFDPHRDELLELRFEGRDPDSEHPVEIKRMHSVIDPGCLARLARALKMADPEKQLRIPRFSINGSDDKRNRPGLGRYNPPSLSREEVEAIMRELAELSARRKRLKSRSLSIKVDGIVVATMDAKNGSRVRFHVGGDADLIKVIGEDEKGELTIAGCLLNCGAGRQDRIERRIETEGGQKITFRVSAQKDAYGEYDGAEIEAAYEESSLVMAATVYLRQLKDSFDRESEPEKKEKYPPIWNLCRQFAFGKLNAHLSDQNEENRFASSYSSAEINHHLAGSTLSLSKLYRMLASFAGQERVYNQLALANLLISMAEQAYSFRDLDALNEVSKMLTNQPIFEAYQAGLYYQAIINSRGGKRDEAQAQVIRIVESASSIYKARALLTLGGFHKHEGRFGDVLILQLESLKAVPNESKQSLLTVLMANLNICYIMSDIGDNQRALSGIEALWPLTQLVAKEHPFYFYQYHNSIAVELGLARRFDEAQAASKVALASPYAPAYKEWQETREEILQKLH